MQNLILFFVVLQVVLFFFMALHDWIHLPPLTDIRALEKLHSAKFRLTWSIINGLMVLIPLLLTWLYQPQFPLWVLIVLVSAYGLMTIGTLFAWWIPYFFGSSAEHKAGFAEYHSTHHFLPPRGDNVIPNTFHVLLHLQVWTCLGIALYLLLR